MAQPPTEATLQAHLEEGLLVGGAVAVYRDGELWKDLCIGSADPDGAPVTKDTPFILFSNSKPLAASGGGRPLVQRHGRLGPKHRHQNHVDVPLRQLDVRAPPGKPRRAHLTRRAPLVL